MISALLSMLCDPVMVLCILGLATVMAGVATWRYLFGEWPTKLFDE